MQRLHHRYTIPDDLRGAIVALGNFDGFHLGHQRVAGAAIDWAEAEGRPAIVATFDPHPVRHFRPDVPPFRLTTLDQRQELFADAGADAMLVFDFGAELASTTAQGFVDLLADHLSAAGVVTGGDFSFGKGREGNIEVLREKGAAKGMATRTVAPVHLDGQVVSSSRVREALQAGDPQTAAKLLTRPFAIRGEVIHGDKRGRELGYPTANLELAHYLRPHYGVYAVTARLADGRALKGAANIGTRPQFDPPKELLETYLFDFEGDLYGQEIEVALHHFLRPEASFDTLDALTSQMEADCSKARELLE